MHHRGRSVVDTGEQGDEESRFAAALGTQALAGRTVTPAACAEADEWPTRRVRIVCMLTPGGSQDNIARRPAALPPAGADAFIKAERKRWGEVIRAAGIQPQ